MFVVEVYAAVWQFVFIDGHSCREAAQVFGLSRATIAEMCRTVVKDHLRVARASGRETLVPLAHPLGCW